MRLCIIEDPNPSNTGLIGNLTSNPGSKGSLFSLEVSSLTHDTWCRSIPWLKWTRYFDTSTMTGWPIHIQHHRGGFGGGCDVTVQRLGCLDEQSIDMVSLNFSFAIQQHLESVCTFLCNDCKILVSKLLVVTMYHSSGCWLLLKKKITFFNCHAPQLNPNYPV